MADDFDSMYPVHGSGPAAPSPAQGAVDFDAAYPIGGPGAASGSKGAKRPDPASVGMAPDESQFKKAGEEAPLPELTWGDVARKAGQNFIPSLKETGKSLVHAVTDPVKTLGTIRDLGAGAMSQFAGAIGLQQDPERKKKTEGLVRALENHYANAYGSVPGFKRAVAEDPAGTLMDFSTVLGGAGAGAKVAGFPKIAEKAAQAASLVDPIQRSAWLAKSVALNPATRLMHGLATGRRASSLALAEEAGNTSDSVLREAYNRHASGAGDPAEIQAEAMKGLDAARDQASAQYIAGRRSLLNTTPSFTKADKAIADARLATQYAGPGSAQFAQANNALNEAERYINEVKNFPQTMGRNPNVWDFDNLKKSIWDLKQSTNNAVAKQHLNGVYKGVWNAINDVDPAYAKLMEQYQAARSNIADLENLGLKQGRGPIQTLTKLLTATRTPHRQSLLDQLSQHSPTLPYMLAGHEMGEWIPGGLRGVFEGVGTAAALAHPSLLPGVAGTVIASSPKVAGKLNYGVGVARRALASPLEKGVYYTGRANEMGDEPDSDSVFDRMLGIESGHHQFARNGQPLVSPKGAIGIAQVMPQTGPDAAALAGEPWSLERLKSDPAYNAKLGRAYFRAMLEHFRDPALAAAAYNAGPERVQQAIYQAKADGDDWRNHIPPETRDYVNGVSPRLGRKSGGRATMDHAKEAAGLLQRAEQAKRDLGKQTEPLLKLPDDHIAKALAIANEHI